MHRRPLENTSFAPASQALGNESWVREPIDCLVGLAEPVVDEFAKEIFRVKVKSIRMQPFWRSSVYTRGESGLFNPVLRPS